ncbi:hypothetical protein PUN4_530039 [Paraburkholderia unamae]|nr:hypothetical protein PUN4_530039 [Paraburkholderia unamae]
MPCMRQAGAKPFRDTHLQTKIVRRAFMEPPVWRLIGTKFVQSRIWRANLYPLWCKTSDMHQLNASHP